MGTIVSAVLTAYELSLIKANVIASADLRRVVRVYVNASSRFGLRSRRAVWEAIALAFSYHPKPQFRLRSGRRGPDCRHTFFNQISPDLPILEGRKQKPVRFFAVRKLVALESFFPGVLRGSLQFACGFGSSPIAASRASCSSHHDVSLLSPLVVQFAARFGNGRYQIAPPHLLFQQRRRCESFATGPWYIFARTRSDVSEGHKA